MVSMTLASSDLGADDDALSAEAQKALEHYNEIFTLYDQLKQQYPHQHRYEDDVTEALDTLLVLFPQHLALLLRRGAHHFRIYEYDEACADLTQVLKQEPDHAEALLMRIEIYDSEDQYTELLHDLNQFLAQEPNHIKTLLMRIDVWVYHEKGQDTKLLHDLNRLLRHQDFISDPEQLDKQVRVRFLRGKLYFQQNIMDLALPDLAYVIVNAYENRGYLGCRYYAAVNMRSKIYKAQGKLEEELLDLNALLTPPFYYSQKHLIGKPYGNIHDYSQRALYRRSEIYVAQENYDDALSDLDVVLREEKDDTPAPALTLHKEVSELVVRKQILSKIKGAEENRGIPSLKTLAKMTFFRHEMNIDTSEWVASNPIAVRTFLKDMDITLEAIHGMRELMGELLPTEIFAGKTVFDDLAMHGNAADDKSADGVENLDKKKRKHDAISPSMS